MTPSPIISVSGLRGIVGQSLTPQVAIDYACALAAELPDGPLVVSRDGRPSGRMLADALRAGWEAVGRPVVDAGIAATPTTGVLIRQLPAAGGIQISASHNPAEYNGLKLFGGDGRVLSANVGALVGQRYHSAAIAWVDHTRLGQTRRAEDPHAEHLRLVTSIVDVPRIRTCGFRVLLDANHGAGSLLGCRLLEHLGCDVAVEGAEPSGLFAHPPEPVERNLTGICGRVAAETAAAGFCQDPDADRLALIDENGRYLGEEYTLAICLNHVLRHRPGPVVTNCSTSRMSEDLARRYKVPFYRSKVGEANVADLMIDHNAVFGGEGNGGPIDPRVGYVRDSFVGMALVLQAMAERGLPLSQLADELPRYEILKTTVPVEAASVGPAFQRLASRFLEARPDYLDGLRLDWPDRWLLVRASNTEPIVRLVVEAASRADAEQVCHEAAAALTGQEGCS
jgi:phosphomannomutase